MRVCEWLPLVTAPEVELKPDRIHAPAIDSLGIVRNQSSRVGQERLGRLRDQRDRYDVHGVLDGDRFRRMDDSGVRTVQKK